MEGLSLRASWAPLMMGTFNEVLKMALVDHRRTAPNNPQADGLAERAVQTIKRPLRTFCEGSETPEKWDVMMPWLIFGYICAPHRHHQDVPLLHVARTTSCHPPCT
jgi:hypothetical protein